ncbi:hypothetical protein JTE90_020073 [Oedothorax gibbosus]|uniref:Uncharacterized protein n=1 Tax=Oedothorax gibbosus TaxID=931172 RepID=A0AAV6USX0_9ARAC|nr:hypothetical protein JTE90_020073 [Oedothorax gibbosus]
MEIFFNYDEPEQHWSVPKFEMEQFLASAQRTVSGSTFLTFYIVVNLRFEGVRPLGEDAPLKNVLKRELNCPYPSATLSFGKTRKLVEKSLFSSSDCETQTYGQRSKNGKGKEDMYLHLRAKLV